MFRRIQAFPEAAHQAEIPMKHAITKHKPAHPPVPSLSLNRSSIPSSGKRPFVVGLLVLGLLAVAAFALLNVAAESPPAPMKEVWIPGGEFTMGDETFDNAKPLHKVHVDGFWMDETEVTNEQFAVFVRQTGYVTLAERPFRARRLEREYSMGRNARVEKCVEIAGNGGITARVRVGVIRKDRIAI